MAHPAPSESHTSTSGGAGASAQAGARARVALAALTTHDDFLLELGELINGRASVHPADSIDAALEQLSSERGGQILAIDARASEDVRSVVERTTGEAPHAVILVFSEASEQKAVAASVKGTKVFTVLGLPIEPDKTSAVLEAALDDALQHNVPRSMPAAQSLPRAPQAPHREPGRTPEPRDAAPRPPGGKRRLRWAALAVGVLLAGGAVGFLLERSHHAAPTLTTKHLPSVPSPRATSAHASALAHPAVDTSIVRGKVDDLLEKASRAMFSRHFTAPRGANALVYFRSVLAVDPSNAEARAGLLRVSHVLVSRFQNDIGQSHYNRAALALATLRLAEPHDSHIGPFGIRLSTALINQALSDGQLSTVPTLIAQAQRRGVAAAQIDAWHKQLAGLKHTKRIHTLAQRIAHRISAGQLIGTGSAQSALTKLHAFAPKAPATQQATQALIAALLQRARAAGLAGKDVAQNQWLATARTLGASNPTIVALQRQISMARAHVARGRLEKLLRLARTHLAAGALLQPDNANVAHDLTLIAEAHPDPREKAAADRVQRELAHALVARAEAEARAGRHAAAHADLEAAQQWGASATQLHSAAAKSAKPALPTAAQLAVVAQGLRRIHYVAPDYPQQALARNITGQVTVQYVVTKSGRTRSLQVIAAKPAHVFNRAAVEAIRRWRYSPPKFKGRPIDVPVRTLIRFVLPK